MTLIEYHNSLSLYHLALLGEEYLRNYTTLYEDEDHYLS